MPAAAQRYVLQNAVSGAIKENIFNLLWLFIPLELRYTSLSCDKYQKFDLQTKFLMHVASQQCISQVQKTVSIALKKKIFYLVSQPILPELRQSSKSKP
jgi:hypothetical protein